MPELIDKIEALGKLQTMYIQIECACGDGNLVAKGVRKAYKAIERMPTIEVEPVRKGRWAKAADKQYCTNCRAVTKVCNAPFCWHCGAQMDLRTPTEVQLDEADSVMMGGADNA